MRNPYEDPGPDPEAMDRETQRYLEGYAMAVFELPSPDRTMVRPEKSPSHEGGPCIVIDEQIILWQKMEDGHWYMDAFGEGAKELDAEPGELGKAVTEALIAWVKKWAEERLVDETSEGEM